MTDTDPPWILSDLTKLLFQPTLAIVQEYSEFFHSPVKLRVFQYLIFKIWGVPVATGMPNKSQKTMLKLCFYTAFVFKSRPVRNYFCRWCLSISTYFITVLVLSSAT